MNGIHDMGGRHGFGRIVRDDDGTSPFHEPWEGRVMVMVGVAIPNVDAFRHAIERMDPVEYLRAGYYGRWLAALETLAGEGHLAEPGANRTARRKRSAEPRFAAGNRVRARNHQPRGHTRLPAYARGRTGVVERVHPDAWVLPDTNAHFEGESPEPVYAVRFEAQEIWGDAAEPDTAVIVDLFESYLEVA